ncbi:2389_t:CDS:2, partial [Racocetra fulgida]
LIVSGSWDQTVRTWDVRDKDSQTGVYKMENSAKVFAISLVSYRLVVATASRQFYIYDIRNMSEILQTVEFFDPSPEVQARADGVVNIWDGFNKKRLRQYPQYPTSIASLDFNKDGQYLAIASSYTFEEGEKDHPPDSVFIRHISENE